MSSHSNKGCAFNPLTWQILPNLTWYLRFVFHGWLIGLVLSILKNLDWIGFELTQFSIKLIWCTDPTHLINGLSSMTNTKGKKCKQREKLIIILKTEYLRLILTVTVIFFILLFLYLKHYLKFRFILSPTPKEINFSAYIP